MEIWFYFMTLFVNLGESAFLPIEEPNILFCMKDPTFKNKVPLNGISRTK